MTSLGSGEALAEITHAILVTPNCAAALSKLQASGIVRTTRVRVDATCITQASKEDKRVQVEVMEEIYEKTPAVVVWLGDKWTSGRYKNVAASTAR